MMSELATTFILSGLRLEDDISLVIAVCVDPDPEIDSNPLRFIKFPYMAERLLKIPDVVALTIAIKI